MTEQKTMPDVGKTIEGQIEKRKKRITDLRSELKRDITSSGRLREIVTTIELLDHAIGTLIELHHVLRLCDCPDEAYK